MNKYIATLVFYLVGFIISYVVNKYTDSPQDGGLSWGSVVIMVGMLVILVLLGINVYKGFSVNKEYFMGWFLNFFCNYLTFPTPMESINL
jgi:hypothetical protein